MKLTARAAAAVMAACIAITPALAAKKAPPAPACVKGADETALELRVVQTDLMVAALSCSASARYNDFVKANQPVLLAAHNQLTAFFKKRGGATALNAFITKLANDSSRRSIADIGKFCQDNGWLYDYILGPTKPDLPTLVNALLSAQTHGFTSCTPRATYLVMSAKGPVEVAAATPAAPAAPAPAAPGKAPANPPAPDTSGVPTPQPKPATIASR